jgi:hypothetical protein
VCILWYREKREKIEIYTENLRVCRYYPLPLFATLATIYATEYTTYILIGGIRKVNINVV